VKALLFACLLLGALHSAAWCDMLARPPRRPQTVLAVANLKAFPGFRFTCSASTDKVVPLQESQVFHGTLPVNLFVEDGVGKRFQWATVPVGDAFEKTISILNVHRDGKKIKVRYKFEPEPASQGKSTQNGPSPATLLLLSGFSLGAVVLLGRKKRAAAPGS
jgi:hypothetical protein